ncbi:MAG: S8 family peptidase [Bryobacteraceae bacterium]
MKLSIQPIILLLLLFASAGSAFPADQFIVRAPLPYMQELAAKFGLSILKQIPRQDIFLVLGPEGIAPEQVIQNLKNYDYGKDPDNDDDDDDDLDVEADFSVVLAESGPGVPRLISNTAPVVTALQNPSFVSFHGEMAWSGYVLQPALSKIRVAETHSQYGTGGTIVAVIDTGIDPEHPLLRNWLVPGYDFVRDLPGAPSELDDLDPETRSILSPYTTAILDTFGEANPYTTAILDQYTASRLDPSRLPPQFGHGTMVAGLIRLVAPSARIMPLKPFGGDGKAKLFHLLQAMYFAVDNGAKVVNMSLSLAAPSVELQRAVDFAARNGVVLISSVGNSGLEIMSYPAGYKEVIGVASTNIDDVQSPFTNFGDNVVTLAAPGEALVTLYPGGRYAAAWGTSFSAPLVSGTAAMMTYLKPSINWEKAEAGLKEAAPVDGNLGNGRLDVYRAGRKATEF